MGHQALVKASGSTVAIELPGALAAGWKPNTAVQYVPYGNDAGFFCRGESLHGFFAGSLQSFELEEIFGHVTSGMRTGVLIIHANQLRKSVNFRDGQVTFATSTESHERLGAALVRRKLLTAEQLKKALAKVKPGTRLGQVLTQTGMTTAASLYTAMTEVVSEIVLGLFSLREGHFLFLEGLISPDAVKLPRRTRELMLDGLKLADELKRLRSRLPDSTKVAKGSAATPPEGAALVRKAGAGVELSALRSMFAGGEHAFLALIEKMIRSGSLKQLNGKREVQHNPPDSANVSALEMYAALIQAICESLRDAGKDLSDLRSFFEDPLPGMEQAFVDVKLTENGTVDVDRVMKNMRAEDEALGRVKAYEALDGFVSYALFSAKNALSPELADSLAKKFRQIQEDLQV